MPPTHSVGPLFGDEEHVTEPDPQATADGQCEDCGAMVSQGNSSCQTFFDEILAREFEDYRYGKLHRLTVDTYALQHPRYMRSGKSFAAHLTGMWAALESRETDAINQSVQRWLNGAKAIEKPGGPAGGRRGELTIVHVHGAADPEEHVKRVREWADSTWSAWKDHHGLAKKWISRATTEDRT